MKGFQFRLDAVLRVRAYQLERARVELAQTLAFADAARAVAEEGEGRARDSGRALVARLASGATVPEFEIASRGLKHLRNEAARAKALAADAGARIPEARRRAVEARSRHRAIEILRERALARARSEADRVAQAQLDEVAGQRALGRVR